MIPYPVDYHTSREPAWLNFDVASNLALSSSGAKEWIGLVAYRMLVQNVGPVSGAVGRHRVKPSGKV